MPVTRINNNQITDSSAGNVYLGVNAAAKVQDYSVTAGKIANNLVYGSDLTVTGNLTVQGNTTTIDTVNLVVEDPLILLAKEQTGSPTLDIGFIGKRGTSDNIAFVWDESLGEFATVFTSSEVTNTVITINSYASLKVLDSDVTGNLDVAGTSTFIGNIISANVTGNVTAANFNTTGVVTATGNVTGGNVTTGGVVTATGNVTGGNITTAGQVSATGNITTANYYFGNGFFLTGVANAESASKLVNGTSNVDIPTTNGNVTVGVGGTNNVAVISSSGVFVTGVTSVSGTVTGGNIDTAGTVSATGNITGGNVNVTNVSATGNVNAVGFTGGNASVTGNVYAQNFIGNISGNIDAGGANTQVQFNDNDLLNGSANFTFDKSTNTMSVTGTIQGTTVCATGTVTGAYVYSSGELSAAGNVVSANVYTGGQVSATGNVTGGNLVTGGLATVTGNVIGGNLSTAGVVTATGNVTGGNINTGGVVSATGNVNSGNVNTAIVSATGNVTGANFSTTGLVTATGNVTGGNLVTGGLATVTGNVIGGNISTAGVVTATGNVTGGNILTSGLVSATGNVTGNNFTAGGFVSATGNVNGLNVNTAKVASTGGITISSGGSADLTLDSAGNINADSNYINNVGYPQQDADAATKLYVDNMVATGLTYHEAVFAATTANLATETGGTITYNQPNGAGNGIGATITTTGSFNLIDTANVQTAGTRILVKDEGNAVLNGVYVWSNATAITRSTDADEYGANSISQFSYNDYFFTSSGNVNKGSAFVVDAPTGNITFGTSNIQFALFSTSQVYTANTQAGLVLNGTVFAAKVDNDTTAFDGGGNISVKAGANLVTPNIGAATGTSVSLTGNVTGGNLNTAGTVTATGNVTGGNITTAGEISATGNVTANYFIGNGSQLTGVTASSMDAGNLTGNTLSPNVTFSSLTSVGTLTTLSVAGTTTSGNLNTGGVVSASGNITGANLITTGAVTATGNVTGGNINTSGVVSATGNVNSGNINTGIVSATGNVTGGNLITTGLATITGTVTAGNIATAGTVSATGNITGGNINTGIVSATGNVVGSGAVFSGNVSAANFIGNISGNIDAGGANTNVQFNDGDLLAGSNNFTFDKATNIMSVTGTIQGTTISATGNVIGGNILTTGVMSATGNIDTGGNVNAPSYFVRAGAVETTGLISAGTTVSAGGNITGANLITGGLVTASGNITGANITTGGLVTATGNVTGANITTSGLITATGNITGANVILTSGIVDGPSAGRITINGSGLNTDFAVDGDTVPNIFYVDAGTSTASFGSSLQTTGAIVSFQSTDSILMPVGNTLQRPGTGVLGMLRFNSTGDSLEVYTSGGWEDVGVPAFTVITADSFSGNGSQTIFTLSQDSTTAATIVSINGVVQIPTTAYSVSGNLLTFTEAPAVSDTIDARLLTTTTTVTAIDNTSGNAMVQALDTADTIQITGNLLPAANVTYDLGSNTRSWRNGYFSGSTIFLGNLQLKQADATTFAVYTADGVTQANIDVGSVDVSSIISGTTVIGIGAPNGNAYLAPAGSNALVAASTGVFVTGVMSASGNVTAANVFTAGTVSATGNVTGNFILGNGSLLTGIDATSIQSGTSNVRVVSSGGNVTVGIGGTGNVVVVSSTGANVTGTLNATGVLTAGADISLTGNIVDTGDLSIITSSNGNITLSPNGTGVIIASKDLLNGQANGVGNIGNATGYFNTIFAKATSAQYADLAEMYEADGTIEPGTVVAFGGSKEVTTCGEDSRRRVAGVISTNPSYIMNAGLAGDHVVAVALTGRVPTRVTGTIRKGDMLVSAGSGRARAEANPAVGAVIGKALADFDGAEGTIEVVVGRL